jgi:putative glutamine amidotransferase
MTQQTQRPLIGITPDRSAEATDAEAQYYVRRNYCNAVAAAGGTPLVLPYENGSLGKYLDLIDGLLITGGMFDVAPALYGQTARHPEHMLLKTDRTSFEQAMLQGALARRLPVLGICGGMQLIAVQAGAELVQHIPSEIAGALEHKQGSTCSAASHSVLLQKGSQLRGIAGVAEGRINSLHHQSVKHGSRNLRIGALAEDGVIEAIELLDYAFCLGVQWHPEYLVNDWERRLFAAFVEAARPAA